MNRDNKYIVHLIEKMTLDQKVGAMLTLGFAGTVVQPHIYDFIEKYHCGGLRLTPHGRSFGNYVNPKTGETVVNIQTDNGYKKGVPSPQCTASEYKEILDSLKEAARKRPLGIPLHFSFDQEGGESANACFHEMNLFPRAMGIRASGDCGYAYEIARAVGRQCRAIGFNWVHSPVLDVNTEPDNPEIGIRSYSNEPNVVAEYARQACLGFREAGMIATAKHFPGRGDSPVDAHFELPVIEADMETLWDRELLPYRILIKEGLLPSIMIAHSLFPALDDQHVATVSKKILTGLLRETLGYEGVITTDSMTMGGIAVRYGVANACAMALEAGADLVLMKSEGILVEETFQTIKRFIEEGRITIEEVDRKVYRILSLKYEYGLFHASEKDFQEPEKVLRDPSIKRLSQNAALRSVLIGRSQKGLLPLHRDEKILVIEQADTAKFLNLSNYPGMLYHECTKYNRNAAYLETSYTYDGEDVERIRNKIKEFDTVIVTNYFARGRRANTEMIKELSGLAGKKIIVITNSPYKMTVPDNADTVIITFSPTIENAKVVAGTLFGEVSPLGEMPVSNSDI